MQAHSLHLSTAEVTAIVIAAAGGIAVIVTAAASAIAADIQRDGSRHPNKNGGPFWNRRFRMTHHCPFTIGANSEETANARQQARA